MRSILNSKFRQLFAQLPSNVQDLARKNYELWRNDPGHPSLDFKKAKRGVSVYSIRVGNDWRALGQKEGDLIVWFWIGSHSDYDKLLSQL